MFSMSNKNNKYENEHSSTINYRKNVNQSKMRSLGNNSPDPAINDRHFHKFRHRLKLALLEKIENLESLYLLNKSIHSDPNTGSSPQLFKKKKFHKNMKMSASLNSTPEKNLSNISKPKNSKTENQNPAESWLVELKNSRSMALEFKRKNESTHIWWLNESLNPSSTMGLEDDNLYLNANGNPKPKMKLAYKKMSKYTDNSENNCCRPSSFFNYKMSNNEQSQSTLSKSSVSFQFAQATGYQSTTEELSSFNHDTDGKPNDFVGMRAQKLDNGFGKKNVSVVENVAIPKLELQTSSTDTSISQHHHCPLNFCLPYQKDDLCFDTISDSNASTPHNFDTYTFE